MKTMIVLTLTVYLLLGCIIPLAAQHRSCSDDWLKPGSPFNPYVIQPKVPGSPEFGYTVRPRIPSPDHPFQPGGQFIPYEIRPLPDGSWEMGYKFPFGF